MKRSVCGAFIVLALMAGMVFFGGCGDDDKGPTGPSPEELRKLNPFK